MKPSSIYVVGMTDEGKKKCVILPGVGPREISADRLKEFDVRYGQAHDGRIWFKRYATIPCGHCELCRKRNSNQWALRAELETIERGEPLFLTLTYDEAHLPADGKVHKEDLQGFLKRLRAEHPAKITYMACGEYGPQTNRPHFHACIWGWKPEDLKLLWNNGRYNTYDSNTIKRLWGKGFITAGTGDAGATARYIASYIKKEATWFTASKRPAIGLTYWQNHELGPDDQLYIPGHKHPAHQPRYFLKKQTEQHPEEMEIIKKMQAETQNLLREGGMAKRDDAGIDDSNYDRQEGLTKWATTKKGGRNGIV